MACFGKAYDKLMRSTCKEHNLCRAHQQSSSLLPGLVGSLWMFGGGIQSLFLVYFSVVFSVLISLLLSLLKVSTLWFALSSILTFEEDISCGVEQLRKCCGLV